MDQSLVNGHRIAETGFRAFERNKVYGLQWPQPRLYRIDPTILHEGKNEIQIELYAIDEKAALFRGPIRFSDFPDNEKRFRKLQFLWIHIPLGIVFVVAFVGLYWLIAVGLRLTDKRYLFAAFAVLTYLAFGSTYAGIPVSAPYLVLKQITFIGGSTAVIFFYAFLTAFLSEKKRHPGRFTYPLLVLNAIIHLLPGSLENLYQIARVVHVVVIIFLVVIFYRSLGILWRGVHGEPVVANRYLVPLMLLAVIGNMGDYAVRMYWWDGPFLFQYGIFVFALYLIVMESQLFQNARERIKAYSREIQTITQNYYVELEKTIARERQHIYMDLHDHIGSKLTDIYLSLQSRRQTHPSKFLAGTSHKLKTTLAELRNRVSSIEDFENLKDNFHYALHSVLLRRYAAIERELEFEATPAINPVLARPENSELRIMLYTIAQEITTNDLKYGRDCSKWRLSLQEERGWIQLEMEALTVYLPENAESGSGMRNIQQRVAELDGIQEWRIEKRHAFWNGNPIHKFFLHIKLPFRTSLNVATDSSRKAK